MKFSLFSTQRLRSTGTASLAALCWLAYLHATCVAAQANALPPAQPGHASASDITLHIAVAANFTATLQKLLDAYARSAPTAANSVISSASTGTLFHQIVHGAPFDVFFAANEVHPRELLARGLGVQGSLLNYAQGQLVLLHKKNNRRNGDDIALQFTTDACKRNANANNNADALSAILQSARQVIIANPLTAPYGSVSKQLIEQLKKVKPIKRDSIVPGNTATKKIPELLIARNVMHAQQLFASSAADAAFISLPQFQANPQAGRKQSWLACHVNTALHKPILQFAIALANANRPREYRSQSVALLAFANSNQGRRIIAQHGYVLAPTTPNSANKAANNVE
ncbi:MAG: molybdate ABC transporter substrate-binding protein [Gammaproteobacteria bacterium]|nr:molybdate ABC transporter substrate-binding protein [Gammaproteobacteria bacterium]